MANQDADELHEAAVGNDDLEGKEYTRQVHCLELGSEPEGHDLVFV